MTFPSKHNRFVKATFATEEQRDLYDFMYEYALDNETMKGAFAWGQAMTIAADHPSWTFWQVLAELRRRSIH